MTTPALMITLSFYTVSAFRSSCQPAAAPEVGTEFSQSSLLVRHIRRIGKFQLLLIQCKRICPAVLCDDVHPVIRRVCLAVQDQILCLLLDQLLCLLVDQSVSKVTEEHNVRLLEFFCKSPLKLFPHCLFIG